MEADFSGWATKAGLKCADGRTIMRGAFEHMDQEQVPLVWRHGHESAENVLGHVILENRDEGVYAYGFFNGTKQGLNTKELVQHGDLKSLSIYANQLVEKGKNVIHGMIREVSLVLAGANPGAKIDYVRVAHSDGSVDTYDDEVIIHTGLDIELEHAASSTDMKTSSKKSSSSSSSSSNDSGTEDKRTIEEIYDSMDEAQKNVTNYLIGAALEEQASNDSNNDSKSAQHSQKTIIDGEVVHQEGAGRIMSRNVFDQTDGRGKAVATRTNNEAVLSHEDLKGIVADAMKQRGSLKEAFERYAVQHNIESIDTLFPDAKTLNNIPDFNQRRNEWVPGVLNGVRRSPFSRVKSIVADLTQAEARAKGYIKGNMKKEEWFGVTKRSTTPTTVYKKQKLDRDDMVDITDFDVVAWLRAEMRMMLEEELARAILIGDGRDVSNEDKIKDPMAAADGAGVRSILNEHELYATQVFVNVGDAGSSYLEVVESILRARKFYKGSGTPTFYAPNQTIVELLLTKDAMGRRYWNSMQELAAALMVSNIVEVEVMEDEPDLLGIIVNLADYNVGADRGGEVSLFDDFDIDYNQYKYLIETRISGALVKVKSALVIKKVAASDQLLTPTEPTFVESTGVVTIPSQTGVVYKDASDNSTLSSGAQTALAAGDSITVMAQPASGYFFATNGASEWTFKRPSA